MDRDILVGIVVVAVASWVIWMACRENPREYSESTDGFSSNGVSVNYVTGELVIWRHRTHVSKLSGVTWESEPSPNVWTTRLRSTAVFYLKDMDYPIIRVSMPDVDSAELFIQRFRLAVEKARSQKRCPPFVKVT